MPQALNILSGLAAFFFGSGVIYLFLNYTIGKIKKFNSKFTWHGLQIKDLVFLIIAILLILLVFDFKKPY